MKKERRIAQILETNYSGYIPVYNIIDSRIRAKMYLSNDYSKLYDVWDYWTGSEDPDVIIGVEKELDRRWWESLDEDTKKRLWQK